MLCPCQYYFMVAPLGHYTTTLWLQHLEKKLAKNSTSMLQAVLNAFLFSNFFKHFVHLKWHQIFKKYPVIDKRKYLVVFSTVLLKRLFNLKFIFKIENWILWS